MNKIVFEISMNDFMNARDKKVSYGALLIVLLGTIVVFCVMTFYNYPEKIIHRLFWALAMALVCLLGCYLEKYNQKLKEKKKSKSELELRLNEKMQMSLGISENSLEFENITENLKHSFKWKDIKKIKFNNDKSIIFIEGFFIPILKSCITNGDYDIFIENLKQKCQLFNYK